MQGSSNRKKWHSVCFFSYKLPNIKSTFEDHHSLGSEMADRYGSNIWMIVITTEALKLDMMMMMVVMVMVMVMVMVIYHSTVIKNH